MKCVCKKLKCGRYRKDGHCRLSYIDKNNKKQYHWRRLIKWNTTDEFEYTLSSIDALKNDCHNYNLFKKILKLETI